MVASHQNFPIGKMTDPKSTVRPATVTIIHATITEHAAWLSSDTLVTETAGDCQALISKQI
jgi:hypothetical protein